MQQKYRGIDRAEEISRTLLQDERDQGDEQGGSGET